MNEMFGPWPPVLIGSCQIDGLSSASAVELLRTYGRT